MKENVSYSNINISRIIYFHIMYDKKMDKEILEFLRSHYPNLTKQELEICRQVTISIMNLQDIRDDIKNGHL